MVNFTFEQMEEFIAEVSLIIIALALIILVSVFPNPQTLELFNDVIFLIIGAIVGIVGGKQLNKNTEAKKTEKDNNKVA
jgi:hypothetical protein